MRLHTKKLDWIPPRTVLHLLGARRGTVLLESVRDGRYSILVTRPLKILKSFAAVEREIRNLPKLPGELPFIGGLVGLLPYELGTGFVRIPRPSRDLFHLPEVWFGLYDGCLVWDHEAGTLVAVGWSKQVIKNYEFKDEGRRTRDEGKGTKDEGQENWIQDLKLKNPRSNFTKQAYLKAVRQIQKLISAGYTFQVNLSQRFVTRASSLDPITLYDQLARVNPAPFAGFLDAGNFQILSSSPELLYRIQDHKIETWPIAGTRPRGQTKAEEKKFEKELHTSRKEQAEHAMLVDLERNDLGRICVAGSVRPERLTVIEKYARVQHLVSRIAGRLRPGVQFGEIVCALHPGGTITGCPKVETMKIISRLEKSTRGAYTGALGYISANGNQQFNILIRTLTISAGVLSFQTGGGVVADSIPEREYEETLHKAAALFEAILPHTHSTHSAKK